MQKRHVDPRSWDGALRAVKKALLDFPARVPVTEEQGRILGAVLSLCDQLAARRLEASVATNRELARKYAISSRTVTNWRREGCPFSEGQPRVLRWVAQRRYAPAGTRARFATQLRKRKPGIRDSLAGMRAEILDLKARHRAHGAPMPEWLRGGFFRAR